MSGTWNDRLALGTAFISDPGPVIWALDNGIDWIDTAPLYGTEHHVGAALRDTTDIHLSTKVGLHLDGHADYTPAAVSEQVQASTERLGRPLDVVLIHDPVHDLELALAETLPRLEEMGREGWLRRVGVGTNDVGVASAFMRAGAPVVLLAGRWTLIDRSGARALDIAGEKGTELLIGGALNSGLLSGDPGAVTFDYREAGPAQRFAAAAWQAHAERFGIPLMRAALQFPLRSPVVDRLVLGPRSVDQLAEAVAQLRSPIEDSAFWQNEPVDGRLA